MRRALTEQTIHLDGVTLALPTCLLGSRLADEAR
jgi:hypothetical protein